MKELKKLALILRALGITANVVSEQITCNDEIVSNNTFCECLKGDVRFDCHHYARRIPTWRHCEFNSAHHRLLNDFYKIKKTHFQQSAFFILKIHGEPNIFFKKILGSPWIFVDF